MAPFRVALSGDFVKADGTPAFPSFDVSPLVDDPAIEMVTVPVRDGRMDANDLEDFDALILLASRFDAASIPASGRLAMVARFGVGFDNVDVPACTAAGIAVVITPDGVRRPVAVSIITLVLALSQKLFQKDQLTRQGPDGWAKKSATMGEGLIGKTLGSLGLGNIGAEVYRLAAPFGMVGIAYDPYADRGVADSLGVELVSLDELFRRSDYLSVSCPLSEATRGIVNADRLAMMKPTAFIINTARGPVIDQAAIVDALKTGTIAGAGLDVFEVEPLAADDPLLQAPNTILTPHALCWTDQCFAGIGAADVAAVKVLMAGEVPRGIVDPAILKSPVWQGHLERFRASARS